MLIPAQRMWRRGALSGPACCGPHSKPWLCIAVSCWVASACTLRPCMVKPTPRLLQ